MNFNAQASAATVNENYNWEYNYELALWYRIGLAALAQIKFYGAWTSGTYYPVDWHKIKLWGPDEPIRSGVLSPQKRKRWIWSDSPLPNTIFDVPPTPRRDPDRANDHVILGIDGAVYGNESSALALRQEENTHEDDSKSDLEFTLGGNKFTCNSQPSTCGGSMNDQTNEIETRDLGFGRLGSPSSYGAALTKRAAGGEDCAVLPRLYYNCKTAFMDWAFVVPPSEGGTGNTNTMSGICRTLEHLMNDYRSINNQRGRYSESRALCKGRGCTLTFDASNSRQTTRRNQACRSRTLPRRSKCVNDNNVRELYLWGSLNHRPDSGLTSCDEFPFASSEEGGDNYDDGGSNMQSLFGTKTVCVPTWQQSLQGNCNGKSLLLIWVEYCE